MSNGNRHGGFKEDAFEPFTSGREPVPNYVEVPLPQACATIAAAAGLKVAGVQLFRHPTGHKAWARYFCFTMQGGGLDGTGLVLWYDHGEGIAGSFAICRHKKVADADAAPMRGWHPGRCSKCGLDMTVDSGD